MAKQGAAGTPLPENAKEDGAAEHLGEGGGEGGAAGTHVEAKDKEDVHEEVADVGNEDGVQRSACVFARAQHADLHELEEHERVGDAAHADVRRRVRMHGRVATDHCTDGGGVSVGQSSSGGAEGGVGNEGLQLLHMPRAHADCTSGCGAERRGKGARTL